MNKLSALIITILISFQATAQVSQNTYLLFNWTDTNITPVPFLDNQRFNEVWGYEQNGREYAIIGSTMGMHFIDVTGNSPVEVGYVAGKAQGSGIIHRDFKNFGTYLYAVCDEGQSSLQIIDMQYLPDSVHVVYDSDSMIIRAHNLYIDTAMSKLYIFGATSDINTPGTPVGYPAMIFNLLGNPAQPYYLNFFSHANISYVHDGYVHNDTAIFNGGTDGLWYGNYANPNLPSEIDVLPFYQDQGYNHSGWLTPDKKHYIMSDETHGMRMKMLDMEEGVNLLSTCNLIGSDVNQYSIPHNQLFRGNYLYVSYYYDGLRIFDITDPCDIQQVAWYDTYPGDAVNGGYSGAWGTYPLLPSGKILVSDMQTGLYVLGHSGVTLGAGETFEYSFNMFPNPTSDIIQFNEAFQYIRIIDMHGKLVRSYTNQQTINVENLANGIYLVQVDRSGETGFKKLVKN